MACAAKYLHVNTFPYTCKQCLASQNFLPAYSQNFYIIYPVLKIPVILTPEGVQTAPFVLPNEHVRQGKSHTSSNQKQ